MKRLRDFMTLQRQRWLALALALLLALYFWRTFLFLLSLAFAFFLGWCVYRVGRFVVLTLWNWLREWRFRKVVD
jgi:hypothetical protein